MSWLRRREETLNEKLLREAGYSSEAASVQADVADELREPQTEPQSYPASRSSGEVPAALGFGSVGNLRPREAQVVATVEAPELTGESYAFTTLPDGSTDASSAAPYPDVPVLAVSGTLDLRSPRVEARAVLAHFPHGRLVTVTDVGHAALATTRSSCLVSAVRSWVRGHGVPRTCHSPGLLTPLTAFPAESSGRGREPPRPAETLSLVTKTVREAEATWLLASYEDTPDTVPGLRAGRLTVPDTGFTLSGYSINRGVALSGVVQPEFPSGNASIRLHGVIRVKNGAATMGVLAVNGDSLDGRLEGTTVVAGRLSSAGVSTSLGRPGPWSTWMPPSGSTTDVANAIASHVAGEYRLDEAGTKLLALSAGPPTSPRGKKRSILALAVQRAPYSSDSLQFHVTLDTWTYALCGRGANCSIAPGPATTSRGRLVRGEALEVALDTFKFAPEISSLLIYLPPPPGEVPSTLLYFERSQLTRQLSQPLDKTLTLASPPLPSDPDTAEAQRIDMLTLPHLCGYTVAELADGSAELKLTSFD